ncbi:HAD family phosphatase [Embleya sp. NBC_00896]|uniref:HAD family hydrolase n=1 Tax=Embleya sp. NBC_00896 TaxID=2975961 RepID=UPI002F91574E|nr:HAD family phosphatase [Embleya sp. NBC_00896]
MSIRRVVVDLGGVLFRFDHAHRLQRLAAAFSLAPDRVDALLWKSGFSAECDRGAFASAVDVRAAIRAATGFTGGDEQLDAEWCSAFRPDHAVREALHRHRGSRSLALFTNNGPLEEEALPRLHPELFDGFGQLLFSHRLGHRKPGPAAFAAATRRLDAVPDEILFIDDHLGNTDAARSFGWHAVHFRGPETIEQALGVAPEHRRDREHALEVDVGLRGPERRDANGSGHPTRMPPGGRRPHGDDRPHQANGLYQPRFRP